MQCIYARKQLIVYQSEGHSQPHKPTHSKKEDKYKNNREDTAAMVNKEPY